MLAQARLQADWLSHFLFESPGWIIIALAVAWTLMRVVGRRTNHKKLKLASWLPLVLIAALWVSSATVTTKREKLIGALDAMLLAVEHKDTAQFRTLVTEDAQALFPPSPIGKKFTREMIEDKLGELEVKDLLLLWSEAALVGEDTAITMIRVRAQGGAEMYGGVQISTWAIQWRYEQERWRAYDFECRKLGLDAVLNSGESN